MISFFNRKLEVVVPKYDDDGEDIDNSIVKDSVQGLMKLSLYCSITETYDYHNFSQAIKYKFDYLPEQERRDNNEFVHSLYTLVATLILYYEVDEVYVSIDEEDFSFGIKDLDKLQFTLNKSLFQ